MDPSKRPGINQILKFPLVAGKAKSFLNDDDFKHEFNNSM
jgi:hypothetical protein